MQTVLLPPISDAGPNGYSGASAGLHYAEVDENPHDSDTSFLNIFANQSEHYGIDVSAIGDDDLILAVRVRFAVKGGADDSTSQAGLRIGGIDYLGPSHLVEAGAGYSTFTDADLTTNPATGLAWTKANLAVAGLRHMPVTQAGSLPRPRLSQLVAFADIVPPPDRPSGRPSSLTPSGSAARGLGGAAASAASAAPSGSGVSLSPSSSASAQTPAGAVASVAPEARAADASPAAVVTLRDGSLVSFRSLSPAAGLESMSPGAIGAALPPAGEAS